MADPDRTALTDTLEDADANTGVPTVCLGGRVAYQTRRTWCVATPGATTTNTDRNAHIDADTRCTVQYTTLANCRTAAEDQGGKLDCLRSLRNNARAQFEAILAKVEQIAIPLPAVSKLEYCLENLRCVETNLRKLDSHILDLVDEELEDEIEHADLYTECFFHAKGLLSHLMTCRKRRVLPQIELPDRHLQELIANLENHSANSHTRASNVICTDTKSGFPNQPTPPEPLKGERENLSSIAELRDAQTKHLQLNVARASEDIRTKPPPSLFEYIFAPSFMKGESLPELETVSTPTCDYRPPPSAFQESRIGSAAQETAACIECVYKDCCFRPRLASEKTSSAQNLSPIEYFQPSYRIERWLQVQNADQESREPPIHPTRTAEPNLPYTTA